MIDSVRNKATLEKLGLSKRLTARLGSLLARRFSFTEALLESARHGSPLERMIMGDALLHDAEGICTARLRALAQSSGVSEQLTVVETPDGRIVALSEELEAEHAWERSAPLAAGPTTITPQTISKANPDSGLFWRDEMERLKLTALTSANAEEVVSTLRRLVFAPIPPDDQGTVLVHALTNPATQVQAEAARLLTKVGLPADVSEALVSLAQGTTSERVAAIEKLGHIVSGVPGKTPPDIVLVPVLVSFTTTLSTRREPEVCGRVLSALALASGHFDRCGERVAVILRRTAELLLSEHPEVLSGAHELLAGLRKSSPEQFAKLLRTEIVRTAHPRTRAALTVQLAVLARENAGILPADEACTLLVTELAAGSHAEPERQMLGAELLNLPADQAVAAMTAQFGEAPVAVRRQFLRLAAEICRFRKASDDSVCSAGRLFLECLTGGVKELRLTAMETVFCCDRRLGAGLRARLAAAYLNSLGDLVFRPDVDLAENTLARMGHPALPALLDRMAPAWPAADRIRACRITGELARISRSADSREAEATTDLLEALRRLLLLSAGDFPDPETLAVSLGKLALAVGDCGDSLQTAWRRINEMPLPEAARAEALSWATGSTAADSEKTASCAAMLLRLLATPEPAELGRLAEVRTGRERSLELLPEAADFAARMPAAVRALARTALAPAADPTLRSRIVTAMANRWRSLVSGESIWGPAAAGVLTESLRDLACHPSARPAERLDIVRTLGLRLSDPPAMRTIAEILATDDSSAELAGPAAAAALAILSRRGAGGRIPAEEREHVLWSLARIIGRQKLDTSSPRTARLRERIVEELCSGFRDNVPGAREMLQQLAGVTALSGELRLTISAALGSRGALIAARPARTHQ